MSKVLKYLPYLLFGVSIILLLYFMANTGTIDSTFNAAGKTIGEGDASVYVSLTMFLNWAYILLGVGAVLAIVLPLISMIQNPTNLKKMAINIGFVVALFVVAFVLAKGDPLPSTATAVVEASAQSIKIIDAGLIATYILIVIAFLAILLGAVRNSVKNR